MKGFLVLKKLRSLFHVVFNRKARTEVVGLLERMKKEGKNILSKKDRRSWIRNHRKESHSILPEDLQPSKLGKHKMGRNEPCPCGSGKKLKKCCKAVVE